MSVSWRTAILAVGVAVLGAASTQGYPIPPVTLWNLVEQSETVVVAQVVDISERPVQRGDEEDFAIPEAVATLKVLETWKGEAFGEIRVEFPAGLICPAPPRYVEDEDVVAFLSREDGAWQTVGLSYGTLYPEGREELQDLRIMVRRALALQQKGRVRKSDRIDWFVEAASRPGTRWHGLYELEPRGDRVHAFYDPERPRKSRALTPAQLQTIAHGFVSHPPVDVTLSMTLKVLAGHPDPKVDETAAAAIEGLLGQERLPYWIDQALTLVFQRFGDRAAETRVAALREGCCDLKEEEVRVLWRSVQSELGIPKVAPLRVAPRKVRGVGPGTPD